MGDVPCEDDFKRLQRKFTKDCNETHSQNPVVYIFLRLVMSLLKTSGFLDCTFKFIPNRVKGLTAREIHNRDFEGGYTILSSLEKDMTLDAWLDNVGIKGKETRISVYFVCSQNFVNHCAVQFFIASGLMPQQEEEGNGPVIILVSRHTILWFWEGTVLPFNDKGMDISVERVKFFFVAKVNPNGECMFWMGPDKENLPEWCSKLFTVLDSVSDKKRIILDDKDDWVVIETPSSSPPSPQSPPSPSLLRSPPSPPLLRSPPSSPLLRSPPSPPVEELSPAEQEKIINLSIEKIKKQAQNEVPKVEIRFSEHYTKDVEKAVEWWRDTNQKCIKTDGASAGEGTSAAASNTILIMSSEPRTLPRYSFEKEENHSSSNTKGEPVLTLDGFDVLEFRRDELLPFSNTPYVGCTRTQ